jgi:hypothetical protein
MTASARQEPHAGNDQTAATLATVRAYHDGWVSQNFGAAAALLAPNLSVEVPINEYPTRDSFVTALSNFGRMTTRVKLLDEFAHGSTAMLLYDMEVEGLGTLRVANTSPLNAARSSGFVRFTTRIRFASPMRRSSGKSPRHERREFTGI